MDALVEDTAEGPVPFDDNDVGRPGAPGPDGRRQTRRPAADDDDIVSLDDDAVSAIDTNDIVRNGAVDVLALDWGGMLGSDYVVPLIAEAVVAIDVGRMLGSDGVLTLDTEAVAAIDANDIVTLDGAVVLRKFPR